MSVFLKNKFLLAYIAFFVLSSAHASVTIISIKGSSGFDIDADTTTPIIYGGIAGADCTSDATDLFTTCNSCDSTIKACNTTRIYDTLKLVITFKVDTLADGDSGPVLAESSSDENDNVAQAVSAPTGIGKGETTTITMEWKEICKALKGTSSCELLNATSPFGANIDLGIDADGDGNLDSTESGQIVIKVSTPDATNAADDIGLCVSAAVTDAGICDFTAGPGDEKVFIKSLEEAEDFPNAEELNFDRVRFFISKIGFDFANPNPVGDQASVDIDITTNESGSDLQNKTIDNLDNGDFYYFRLGVVDPANNVAYITSNQAIIDACGVADVADLDADKNPTDAQDLACQFMAKPDEVFGLLRKDFNCFISTVTYGSLFHPKVSALRDFRNKILLKLPFGKYLIKKYYKYGPYGARWITENNQFKPIGKSFFHNHSGRHKVFACTCSVIDDFNLLNSLISIKLPSVYLRTTVSLSNS